MNFLSLIKPLRGPHKRTKREVARAILYIPREDDSNNIMLVAECLAKHEVLHKKAVILTLARCLASVGQLHNVRLLSRQAAHIFLAEGAFNGLFRRMYISPMYTSPYDKRSRRAFDRVAHGCTEIVVNLKECYGNHQYPPGLIFYAESRDDINDWTHVFKNTPNLRNLTVATGGCLTGVLWNRTSSALTALRTAFEEAGLQSVTTLRMAPADMIYIGQFKWSGPAFGRASAVAERVWRRITKVELQLLPLVVLDDNQRIQTFKMFSAWLQALAPHLQSLKLCYLGGGQDGRHPFSLLSGLDIKNRRQSEMRMPELRELWLGHVKDADDGRHLLETLAPNLEKLHILVQCHSNHTTVNFDLCSPKEQWKTVYVREQLVVDIPHHRDSKHVVDRLRGGSVSSQSAHQRQHTNRGISNAVVSAPPSPSTSSVQEAPSTKSRTPSSSLRGFMNRSSSEAEPMPAATRTSLPTSLKPIRRRTSSVVSSILKFKVRPKSEPSKPVIKLIGETPLEQVRKDFSSLGTNFTMLSESIARYDAGTISDLSQPPALRRADGQTLGMFKYTPGTLFQAGTGARLPSAVAVKPKGHAEAGASGKQATPEQIKKAFADMASRAARQVKEQTHSASPQSPITDRESAGRELREGHRETNATRSKSTPNAGQRVKRGRQMFERGAEQVGSPGRGRETNIEHGRRPHSGGDSDGPFELGHVEEEQVDHWPGPGYQGRSREA